MATRHLAQAEGAESWRLLRELCAGVLELRRGDHSAERLRLEREERAAARQRTERERIQEFWEWAMKDEVRLEICPGFRTQAEKLELLRQILFRDSASEVLLEGRCPAPHTANPPAAAPPPIDPGESSPIKPGESACI